jgi:hypothetical protein
MAVAKKTHRTENRWLLEQAQQVGSSVFRSTGAVVLRSEQSGEAQASDCGT